MITSSSVSVLKNCSTNPIWESCDRERNVSSKTNKPFVHPVSPSDPQRQANRLPIKILKMLTARAGHILHPEYLQPLPSTPVSPIEVRYFNKEGQICITLNYAFQACNLFVPCAYAQSGFSLVCCIDSIGTQCFG